MASPKKSVHRLPLNATDGDTDDDDGLNTRHELFERLSNRGVFKSLQSQMRNAITNELTKGLDANGFTNEKEDAAYDRMEKNQDGDRGIESLSRVSSIANWERNIRYELEIEREIQMKDIERQKEKIQNEWRKLNERDRVLRIELDARERKIRMKEDSIKNDCDELSKTQREIHEREQMINEIVQNKTRLEVNDQMEKLRKKFYELEVNKTNLEKKKEMLKDVEQRLYEQATVVKEKIDKRKDNEIETAKIRKEYEIMKKEYEVMKVRFKDMEDYHIIKFENNSLKNELKTVKETLNNKVIELDNCKEKSEKECKVMDEKILKLKMEMRKHDHEHLLMMQKHQGEANEWTLKFQQLTNELQQSKTIAHQLSEKNQMLSKDVISIHKQMETVSKLRHKSSSIYTQTDTASVGCQICDHSSNAIDETSLHFLVSARQCMDDLKHETYLIEERNKLSLQQLAASQLPNIMTLPVNASSSTYEPPNPISDTPLASNQQLQSPLTHDLNKLQNGISKDNSLLKNKISFNTQQMENGKTDFNKIHDGKFDTISGNDINTKNSQFSHNNDDSSDTFVW